MIVCFFDSLNTSLWWRLYHPNWCPVLLNHYNQDPRGAFAETGLFFPGQGQVDDGDAKAYDREEPDQHLSRQHGADQPEGQQGEECQLGL